MINCDDLNQRQSRFSDQSFHGEDLLLVQKSIRASLRYIMTLADWDMIFSLKKNLGPHRPGKRHENSSNWKTNGKTFLSSKFRGRTSESYAIPKTCPNWVLNQEQVFAFKASRRSFSRPFCVTAVKPLIFREVTTRLHLNIFLSSIHRWKAESEEKTIT